MAKNLVRFPNLVLLAIQVLKVAFDLLWYTRQAKANKMEFTFELYKYRVGIDLVVAFIAVSFFMSGKLNAQCAWLYIAPLLLSELVIFFSCVLRA